MEEIWKDINGYEGYYQVSNLGRIKSIPHKQSLKERILKPDTSMLKNGYERITLSKNSIAKRFFIHRLVAEMFIPNPENKPYINHLDNNGLNNQITNLEWCSHSENMIHAQKQGRLFESQSKGGKLGSKTNLFKAVNEINSLVGITKNKWKILGISEKRSKNNRLLVDVLCTGCNRIFHYQKNYVLYKLGEGCPKCRKRKIKI